MRVVTWAVHLAVPVLGLWLLLARPELDVHWEHHGWHFALVLVAAAVSLGLAVVVDERARGHDDTRLVLVSLSFLVGAGFLGVHAVLTPQVLTPGPTAGFALATPAGLLLGAVAAVASVPELPARTPRVLGRTPLRAGVGALLVVWTALTVAGVAPLGVPLPRGTTALLLVALVAALLYAVAAVGYFTRYRKRPDAVLLSVITAYALLAEAAVAVGLAPSWRLSWWVWHVLMLAAFAFVAYSARLRYRREGSVAGLFSGIVLAGTVADLRRDHSAALEELVEQMRVGASGAAWGRVRERLASRFALTDAQLDVLERGAATVADERRHVRRLDGLVAVGRAARVVGDEHELLTGALDVVRAAFREAGGGGDVGLGVVRDGRLTPVGGSLPDGDGVAAMRTRVLVTGEPAVAGGTLVLPLTVTGRPVGVLQASGGPLGERDRSVLASLASQLSIALENVRLYRQLDGLFRSYLSPEVAAALVADPERAALGGSTSDVTVLMADLVGFTPFAERTAPADVVAVLNAYYRAVVPAVVAEGGIVVQFVGDALMALFGAPVAHPDHADRAVRAALALQAAARAVARPGWPAFRVGVNSGPALVGNIGSDTMRNYTAIGDTTNLAARLESVAPPGGVVVGVGTRARLTGPQPVHALEPLHVKGKREPVEAYLLV